VNGPAALVLGGGLLIGAIGATSSAADERYLLEPELWIEGRSVPIMPAVLLPDQPVRLQSAVVGPGREIEDHWRLTVTLEAPQASPLPSSAVWLLVEIERASEEAWELVTDSLLGVALGEAAEVLVSNAPRLQASADDAELRLRLKAARLRPDALYQPGNHLD